MLEEKLQDIETVYDCGVVCLHAEAKEHKRTCEALANRVESGQYGFALVLFSNSVWHATDIVEMMNEYAPVLPFASCSTAGELTPSGMTDGDFTITLFPTSNFEIEGFFLARGDGEDMQGMVSQITDHKNRFFSKDYEEGCWPLAICLMDGMSNNEEAIAAALHWSFEDIPLLGGSAGDNLRFQETSLILNGEVVDSSAVILMIKSRIELEVFKTENFVPTDEKLVVTQSEPDKRIVWEFNGTPAAETYSDTIHSDPVDLAPQSFASHPLVVKVGGEYFCRSIQKVNDDGSLTFFCAIDDGIVLTVAEPRGMVESTKKKLVEIDEKMGGIDFIIGFDCVLRKIDAGNRQVTRAISDVYRDFNVIGFNTYGEQYHSMHLNQTLTGVAFRSPSNR